MNTIEGNRLIAEFMGWRLNIVNRPNSVIQDRIEKEYHVISPDGRLVQSCSTTFHGTELETKDNILKHLLADYGWWGKYHTSWDWLMPVIEKISTLRWPEYYGSRGKTEDDEGFDDCVYPRTFGMRDKNGLYMVRLNASALFSAETLIEATWLAVIDFIEWYKNNPQ